MNTVPDINLQRWQALQEIIAANPSTPAAKVTAPVLVFSVEVPIPEIGAHADDLLILDPADKGTPVAIYRPLAPSSVVDVVGQLGHLKLLSPTTAHPAWQQQIPPQTQMIPKGKGR